MMPTWSFRADRTVGRPRSRRPGRTASTLVFAAPSRAHGAAKAVSFLLAGLRPPSGAAAERPDQADQALGPVVGAQHPAAERQRGGHGAAHGQDGDSRGACREGERQADAEAQAYGDRDAGTHGRLTTKPGPAARTSPRSGLGEVLLEGGM